MENFIATAFLIASSISAQALGNQVSVFGIVTSEECRDFENFQSQAYLDLWKEMSKQATKACGAAGAGMARHETFQYFCQDGQLLGTASYSCIW